MSTTQPEQILRTAATVLVLDGDAPPLTVSGDEIAELARRLELTDRPLGRCLCLGWGAVSVHDAAGAEVARWTLHHEVNLRGLDGGERELRDGPGLVDWLAERGLPGRLRVREHLARYSAALERRRLGWVACAPPALTRAADAATHSPDRHQERLAIAILRWYPDPAERIRMLLEWARYRAGPDDGADESVVLAYGGTYFYESTLHRLLLEEPWDALVAAPRTPAQRDGLAELADSPEWKRAGYPKLPDAAG